MVLVCVAVTLGIIVAEERAKREPMTFSSDCVGGRRRIEAFAGMLAKTAAACLLSLQKA
jgi:hypothetical protein